MKCLLSSAASLAPEKGTYCWLAFVLFLSAPLRSGVCQTPMPSGGTGRSVWLNYFGDQPFTGHLSLHLEGSYRRTLWSGPQT